MVKAPSMVAMFAPWIFYIVMAKLHVLPSIGPAGFKWFVPLFLGGFIAGWLVWSVQVPRWRVWAYGAVDDLRALKHLAIEKQIIWPDGSIFERTEIMSRHTREHLKALEARHAGAGA
jgi:hypothetical protein